MSTRRGCRCSATARVLTDDHDVASEAAVLDLLIRDASIVDGTGAPARVGDRGDAGYGLRSGRDKKTGTNVSVVR
jgi:hypothetical protein